MPADALALTPAPDQPTLKEARALVLTAARTVVVMALPQVNPYGGAGPLLHARQVVLAALPRVDFNPFAIIGQVLQLTNAFERFLGGIADDAIRAAVEAIATALAGVTDWIRRALATLGGALVSALFAVTRMLSDLIRPILTTAANLIGALVSHAIAALRPVLEAGAEVVRGILEWIGRTLRTALGAAGGVVQGVLQWLGGVLRTGLNTAAGVVSGILQWLGGVLRTGLNIVGGMLVGVLQWLGGVLANVGGVIVQGLLGLFRFVVDQMAAIIAAVLPVLRQYVFEPVSHVISEAGKALVGLVGGITTGDPETAPAVAGTVLALAIPFGLAAHSLSVAGELAHPLKNMGLGIASRTLVDLTSLQAATDATIGGAYQAALSRPMEYFIQRRIRSRIPGTGEIAKLWLERTISTADARLWLAYQGFNEGRISAFLEQFDEEVNLMQLRRLLDSGTLPPAWLTRMLQRLGYNDQDQAIIQRALEHQQFAQQRSALYNAAFGLLKDGLASPAQFAANVAPLDLHPRQVSLAVRAAGLVFAGELTALQVTNLRTQASRGLIGIDELGLGLAALGVDAERVRIEQSRARTAITPRIAAAVRREAESALRTLQAAQTRLWVERFRRGLIDEAGLETNLLAVGLDADIVRLTVAIEVAKRTPLLDVTPDPALEDEQARIAVELQRLYVDQFRAGLLDADALLANLVAAGMSEQLAQIRVAQEQVRAYHPPSSTPAPDEEKVTRLLQDQLAGLYRDRFRAGLIDAATYLAALVAMGLDEELATVTVDREELRRSVAAADRT